MSDTTSTFDEIRKTLEELQKRSKELQRHSKALKYSPENAEKLLVQAKARCLELITEIEAKLDSSASAVEAIINRTWRITSIAKELEDSLRIVLRQPGNQLLMGSLKHYMMLLQQELSA